MNNLPAIEVIIIIASVLTALTVISVFSIKIGRAIKRVIHFFDDFLGEEERPGVPARPGFNERMAKFENCMNKMNENISNIEDKIQEIEKELKPNSGTSLRDAINRIEARLEILESNNG